VYPNGLAESYVIYPQALSRSHVPSYDLAFPTLQSIPRKLHTVWTPLAYQVVILLPPASYYERCSSSHDQVQDSVGLTGLKLELQCQPSPLQLDLMPIWAALRSRLAAEAGSEQFWRKIQPVMRRNDPVVRFPLVNTLKFSLPPVWVLHSLVFCPVLIFVLLH